MPDAIQSSGDEPSLGAQGQSESPSLGGAHAVLHLVELLNHEDVTLAYNAVKSLAEIGSESALDALVDFLYQNSSLHLQFRIIEAIKGWENDRSLDILLEAYHIKVIYGAPAVRAFGKWLDDPRVIDTLFGIVDQGIPADAQEAAFVLTKSTDPVVHQRLLAGIDSENSERRRVAVYVFGILNPPNAVSVLLHTRYSDPHEGIRRQALRILGNTGSPAVLETLLEALQHPEYHWRAAAIWSLGSLGSHHAIESLIAHLDQLPDNGREFAEREGEDCVYALTHKGGDEVIKCLLRIAAEPQRRAMGRYAALSELGRLGIRSAIPILVKAAGEERLEFDPEAIHPAAIISLGRLRASEAVDLLCQLVERYHDSDAIWALGEIGDPRAIPFLIPELEHSSWYREAGEALRKIGTLDALAAIAAHPSKWNDLPDNPY